MDEGSNIINLFSKSVDNVSLQTAIFRYGTALDEGFFFNIMAKWILSNIC